MAKYQSPKSSILNLLRENYNETFTIQDVADRIGVDRDTASKYLAVMDAEGSINMVKQIGTTKLFRIKEDPLLNLRRCRDNLSNILENYPEKFEAEEATAVEKTKDMLDQKLKQSVR
ncbi:MAG: hypothetical protein KGH65_00845 [Candidatus Micrarchaeota archaeon]|nr:hypothetical protein [Candidatus Micrarchaeota archaeon]